MRTEEQTTSAGTDRHCTHQARPTEEAEHKDEVDDREDSQVMPDHGEHHHNLRSGVLEATGKYKGGNHGCR